MVLDFVLLLRGGGEASALLRLVPVRRQDASTAHQGSAALGQARGAAISGDDRKPSAVRRVSRDLHRARSKRHPAQRFYGARAEHAAGRTTMMRASIDTLCSGP